MALDPGTENADTGMSAAIYEELSLLLSKPFDNAIAAAPDNEARRAAENILAQARDGWKKLSYCIAKGVVDHITHNMEITGLQATGTVTSGANVSTQQTGPTMRLVR